MNRIVKRLVSTGFVHILSSEVLNKVIASCSGILLVNLISKESYGIYSYALNILNTFLLFSGLGMNSAIIQMGSEAIHQPAKQAKLVQLGYRWGILANAILSVAILIFSFFFVFPIQGAREALQYMAFLPLFYFTFEVIQAFFRIRLMNQVFSYANTGLAIMSAVMLILGAFTQSIRWIVIFRYFAYLTVILVIAYRLRPPIISGPGRVQNLSNYTLSREDKVEMAKVGFVSLVNNSISSLLFLVDGWLIAAIIASSEVLADYHTATLIPFAIFFIPGAVVTYVYPYIASHNQERAWLEEYFKKLYIAMAAVNLLISIGFYLTAPLIFRILFPKYMSAVPIFRVLIIGYFFGGTFRVLSGNILVMLHRLKVNTVIAIVSGLCNIVFDYLWIQQFGSIGAAYATTAIYIISGLMGTGYVIYYLYKLPADPTVTNNEESDIIDEEKKN